MKSLHDEVRQRRAAELPVESTNVQEPGPTLIVCPWQGGCWILPWAQFVAARFDPEGGGRRLEIFFANYRVIATGENLVGLLEDLAAQRVGSLRALPESYRSQAADGAPFLSGIEVRAIGDAAENQELPG